MNIEVIALCDAATDTQRKLNILGAFDCIWASRVPINHPHCALALRIRFTRIEEGEHPIRINIVDEDGKAIVPTIDGSLNIRFGPEDESAVANLIINLQGLTLQKFGGYSVDIAIRGRHETSLPFYVKPLPKSAAGGAGTQPSTPEPER